MVALLIPHDATAQGGDVVLLSEDAAGIVIEFTPRYLPLTKHAMPSGEFARVDFENSVTPHDASPGTPDLPVRSITLVLGSPNATLDIVAADYRDSAGVALLPHPHVRETAELYERSYAPIYDAGGETGFVPAEIARLEHVGRTRGVVLGELLISPVRYERSGRTLRRYTRIIVRVNYMQGAGQTIRGGPMTGGIALNDTRRTGMEGVRAVPSVRTTTGQRASSVLSSGSWFRTAVSGEGIYRLTGQMLLDAGVPQEIDPRTIRLFGNGGMELPLNPDLPAPVDLVENARIVEDLGTPGRLDAADIVLFYGRGTRGWKYDPSTRRTSHYINRYWETNYYWLTYGTIPGEDVAQETGPPVADFRAATVEGRAFREDDRHNIILSGLSWLGQSFNVGDRLTYAESLPGLVPGSVVRYRFNVGARASTPSTFTFLEHGTPLGTPVILSGTQVGSYFHRQLVTSGAERSTGATWGENQSLLSMEYSSSSPAGTGYLDWYEIFYDRQTVASGDLFMFDAPDTTAAIGYDIRGFSGTAVRVFDVTAHDAMVSLVANIHSDTCSVTVAADTSGRRRIIVTGPGGYRTPGPLLSVRNQDLRGIPEEAENVIIAHPSFIPAARRLKEYRERPGPGYLPTLVVDVEEIYNEFGGGIPSPVAIRNYLKYLFENQAEPPKYVLLFGDGDYDYKKVTTTGPNFIPPWETEESYYPLDTYASDDYFAIFGQGGRVNAGLGRLTARTVSEASAMVDKIIEYETASVKDPWKTRVTFVADDGLAAAGENDGFTHLRHAESVTSSLPEMFERSKIYLFEYPTEVGAAGRRKPGVNIAIRDAIAKGTAVLNYSGHGNPRLWAHEAVFVREDDIPLIANKGKYFILVAATCNYSNFDAVNDQSGGEILAARPDAGAIAVLSATRVVFAFQNLGLNDAFFRFLFERDSSGRLVKQRIGDAMYRTKQVRAAANDQKYFLIGDPALVPAFPKEYVVVDSLNGLPADQVADLYALGRSSIAARVMPDSVAGSFEGEARLTVYDADRFVTITDPTTAGTYIYRSNGNVLFRGDATVSADRVGANFIVPKDISYGDEQGRIAMYVWNEDNDGTGFTRNIRIAGTDSTAPPDNEGPEVRLYIDDRNFRPGDMVSQTPTLIVDLSDSSGINTSGAGVGHRLEAWIDDQAASADLSDYYRSRPDTYREGVITYPIGSPGPGSHRIRVRAWDTYNNASSSETVFNIGSADGLSIRNVLNYPNPFRSATYFTFEHNQTSPLDVEVKIFTVAGRMIRSISSFATSDRLVRVPWDGRDREGDEIANGIYLYKVIARTTDGRFSSEALGKLSVSR